MIKANALCTVITVMLLMACGNNEAPTKQAYRFVSPHVKDGRQRVSDDKHFGFTDAAGNEVVPLKYDGARDFSEGLAMVSVYKGDGELKQIACGYVDIKLYEALSFVSVLCRLRRLTGSNRTTMRSFKLRICTMSPVAASS